MEIDSSVSFLHEVTPFPALLPSSPKKLSKSVKKNSSASKGSGKTSATRVMLFGRLRELALYRAEVLRMSGYDVLLPETKDEVAEILRRCALDVAVFSYTLPSTTIEELSEILRDYCPDIPLISISDRPWYDRRIAPSEVVIANEGPAALIAALRRVTQKG
jgi:hypothetical protein